jgi:hypothetical protein
MLQPRATDTRLEHSFYPLRQFRSIHLAPKRIAEALDDARIRPRPGTRERRGSVTQLVFVRGVHVLHEDLQVEVGMVKVKLGARGLSRAKCIFHREGV